ncbi:Uncharacterised protein [Vibrio cholerae]|nr:Uncharacterised protein [Vibrio cholerae]
MSVGCNGRLSSLWRCLLISLGIYLPIGLITQVPSKLPCAIGPVGKRAATGFPISVA